MKKRTVLFSVILVLVLPMFFAMEAKDQSAAAQSGPSLDGSKWNSANDIAYVFFSVGFQRGFEQGQGIMVRATATKSKLDALLSARDKLYMRDTTKGQAGRMTPQQVFNETTLFYKDFRNTPVCWDDAMQIAMLTLTGAAPSDSELAAVRSEDAKEGCAP
jgi:hypothetical protein